MTHAGRLDTPTGWSIRWNAERAARAYGDGWWRRETCGGALRVLARSDPGRVLLIDGAVEVTARELWRRAERLALALSVRCPPGTVVSFMLPNWHEAAVIYCAATLAGLVANPILPNLRDHDLRFILRDARSRMVFVPAAFGGHDYEAMLARVCAELEPAPAVVVVRGERCGLAALERSVGRARWTLPPVEPDDVRMVMYTSGTTGRPKGVLHTHNSLGALIRQIGRDWLVWPGDRFLVASPISHIGGSIYAFECPLMLGASAVLMEKWDAAQAVALMHRHRVTHMAGATPFLRQLLVAARAAETRLPELKVFICGGASVPPVLIRDAAAYFDKARVCRVYGSTEVPVTTVGVLDRADLDHAAETDGRPGIAEVRIADDGEIRAHGPQMLVGYIDRADEAAGFDADGFYCTGDQGRFVDGDHLVVTGRIKDLIIRNGENIAPKEIEDLLITHPAIGEVAIVGVPDPRTGERAVAVIVPAGGQRLETGDLAAFLAGFGVAKFKYPEGVVLRDELPKNPAGKVLKPVLRAELAQANRPGDARPRERA